MQSTNRKTQRGDGIVCRALFMIPAPLSCVCFVRPTTPRPGGTVAKRQRLCFYSSQIFIQLILYSLRQKKSICVLHIIFQTSEQTFVENTNVARWCDAKKEKPAAHWACSSVILAWVFHRWDVGKCEAILFENGEKSGKNTEKRLRLLAFPHAFQQAVEKVILCCGGSAMWWRSSFWRVLTRFDTVRHAVFYSL